MYALYSKTNEQFGPWAAKFFNKTFFREVFHNCAEHIVLLSAEDDSKKAIARSMLIIKNNKLFGRYWGCHEFVKNLHFSLCYYEPIDFAIRRELCSFDPGMGVNIRCAAVLLLWNNTVCTAFSIQRWIQSLLLIIFLNSITIPAARLRISTRVDKDIFTRPESFWRVFSILTENIGQYRSSRTF